MLVIYFIAGKFSLVQGNYIISKGRQYKCNIYNDKRRTIEEKRIFEVAKERRNVVVAMKENT